MNVIIKGQLPCESTSYVNVVTARPHPSLTRDAAITYRATVAAAKHTNTPSNSLIPPQLAPTR